MGCGCGRNSGVAPVKVEIDPAPEIIPAMVSLQPMAPITSQSGATGPSVTTTSALASAATGRLSGVPMMRRRTDDTQSIAAQTSLPVAKVSRSYNLLNVVKDTLSGNVEYASDDKAANRLAVCNGCPNQMAGACTKCGCIIKLKVKYEESSCPVGKW